MRYFKPSNWFDCRVGMSFLAAFLMGISARGASDDPVYAENGLVVSASKEASDAGIAIMMKGGNAFDAAAATGFVLAVTHPQAGNIGGGGFLVAHTSSGESLTLDFREKAPSAAHRDMYLDEDGKVVENLSLRSPLASGVPGSVDGLIRIWEDHGSGAITRDELLARAIGLARDGFTLTRAMARQLNTRREFFSNDPGAANVFIRDDGRPWRAGDRLVQTDLAKTLEHVASEGRDGFYSGSVADRFATQMAESGGLITREDLASYRSVYREPVRGQFRGHEVISMGPPSSGGVLIVQMLNMLALHNLETMGWNSSDYIHLLTEVQRRAYADRATHLGDPDFWDVPLATLTSRQYAAERAASISMEKATPSTEVEAGKVPPRESPNTTHYSVIDAEGNAVGVTTTLNASFGSGIVVDGAGFFLNNEMNDFSLKPGVPNIYGLVGGEANAVEPDKRMLSSMSPTIVTRDGKPVLVAGSPGGSTIITIVLQIILNYVVHGMDVQQAVSAPRHHSQWLPDRIVHEPWGFPKDIRTILETKGHRVEENSGGYIGHANCIAVRSDGYYGAPDPRGENFASAY